MQFHQHTLANGLNLIGEVSPSAHSVALGFFVRTGSRDETPEVSGVSHFLEHMMFKGTPRRSFMDVNLDFDRIGAHYNAYTSEENTVFYAAVLPEYLPQAVDILGDILRPSLRQEDFDMEKNVIIEEIGMYDDRPGWVAYEKARKTYFNGHPLGNSVLGTKDSITQLAREQMQGYFDRRYVATNITVAAAGNFDWKQFTGLVGEHCGRWPAGKAPRLGRKQAKGPGVFKMIPRDPEKGAQEHVFLLSPAPAADSQLRHAAGLLATILGDDSNSRLYWALVDPGLAESADMGLQECDGAGVFFTSLTCEPERTQKNLALVLGILRQVAAEGVTEAELALAKSKVLSRVVRSSERPMGRMQDLGMSWTYLGKYRSVDDELAAFEGVTLKKIRQVLEKFSFEDNAILALGPLKKMRPPRG